MRRDARILIPLLLFVLSFLAIVTGLALLLGLKWDRVLDDVGIVESAETSFGLPLPTPTAETVTGEYRPINISLPTAIPPVELTYSPTTSPAFQPSPTRAALERRVHFASARTGIDAIDRVIDMVLGVDDNEIREALVFSTQKCTHESGLGGPPKCREEEEEGTDVDVLPILGPEGHFFRQDEIQDWRGIGVVGLYAAYEVSAAAFSNENYPAGEYAVVFMESDHQFLVLQIGDGGVVRIDYVIGGEPEDKIEREAQRIILAPLPHGVIPSTGFGNTVTGWAPNLSSPTSTPGDIWLTPTPANNTSTPTPSPVGIQPTPTPGSAGTGAPLPTQSATPSAPSPTPAPSDPTESATPYAPSETASPVEPTPSATPLVPDSSPEFTNLILTRYPYLRKSQTVFPKGTPYIYAVWDYAGMEEGMVVRREWYRHGELWLEREEIWDFAKYGSDGTMFDISIFDFIDGIDPGTYSLYLYVDGVRMIVSGFFEVRSVGFSVKPQASPDGNYLARVEPPGTIILQEWRGKRKELTTFDEIADLAWFPGGQHLFVVTANRFDQMNSSTLRLKFESWVVHIKTGERKMISSGAEDLHLGLPSPSGRHIAGISGTRFADACLYDAYLIVLKLDRDHNKIATYRIEDFGGTLEDLGSDTWNIHPRNIQWVTRFQFTAELREHCLPSFDSGVYLFDLKTMEAKKIRTLVDGSVWAQ